MENPELTEIFEEFRFDVIEWRSTRSGHCWTARQKAYRTALDKIGVQWLDETQSFFKSRLDEIESSVKKHNCPCGFSCDDDRYFQTHVSRTHNLIDMPENLCQRCGKRQRYYHAPMKKRFALCAVCGVDAINEFLGEKIL